MRILYSGPVIAILALLSSGADVDAQRGRGGPPPGPPPSPREAAPIDLTGYWVAVVNEDWRWRMVTPPKGDYVSVPLSEAGREMADAWDPATDGSCRAFGAAGLMRMPTRVHITWEGDEVLRIETDAGEQTRLLRFGPTEPGGAPSLQGHSVAEWERPGGRGRGRGRGGPPPPGGTLKVVTTRLQPGWLRRNGVPYSGQTIMTEYFDRFPAPDGQEWFVVTTIVEDPEYLNGPFVTSSHFRREADASGWNPQPCRG